MPQWKVEFSTRSSSPVHTGIECNGPCLRQELDGVTLPVPMNRCSALQKSYSRYLFVSDLDGPRKMGWPVPCLKASTQQNSAWVLQQGYLSGTWE